MNTFIGFSTYLFENNLSELRFFYHFDEKQKIVYIVLMLKNNCLGYIKSEHYINNDWEITKIAAIKGYGYRMYEAIMDLMYPDNWLIPNRKKMINLKLANTYTKFIERSDIETQKITEKDDGYVNAPKEHDNWFNRRYRLSSRIDIDFAETSYKFIKDTGISLFDKTYKGGYKPTF